jgi:hypothetical protein
MTERHGTCSESCHGHNPVVRWWHHATPGTHLANLDLNLLVALRELPRERNVTRAAERLGVTQPAASAALARLRRHFGDELLIRDRDDYTLRSPGLQWARAFGVRGPCPYLSGVKGPLTH